MFPVTAAIAIPASHQMNLICFLALIVFILIFGMLVWEKVPRIYLSIFGAVMMLVLGVFDIQEAVGFVSWETIGFLLGIFLLIEILAESGFFRWVALTLAGRLNYSPRKILIFFPLLSGLMAAFIDSITVMVFLTAITLELSRFLKFDPAPVVISEVLLANIGGSATVMGDPPNVILGTVLGFSFNDFVVHNGPISLVASLAAAGVSYLMNKKEFARLSPPPLLQEIEKTATPSQIKDRYLLKCGLAGMGFTLFFLIGRPLLEGLGMPVSVSTASLLPSFVILTFGGQRIYRHHFIRRIDAETILFFIGLFVLIGALEKRFIIQAAAGFLASLTKNAQGFVGSVFWGTGIFSAVVDNVPLAMAMTYIIKQSTAARLVPGMGILVWATSLGADLGGNLTPIGASANVVAYSTLQKNGIKIGWGKWLKYAFLPGIAAMGISYICIFLKLRYNFF